MGMKPAQVLGTGGGSLGYPYSYLNSGSLALSLILGFQTILNG
jgi:hypothetical protein